MTGIQPENDEDVQKALRRNSRRSQAPGASRGAAGVRYLGVSELESADDEKGGESDKRHRKRHKPIGRPDTSP